MNRTNASSAGSRCVLWHAPGAVPPSDLVLSLERRGVELSSCASPYAAIARTCLLERENDERTDDPAQRDALVLVLVCPKTLPHPAEVVDAMRRYAPRTACWWYDPSANPRLRAVVDDDVEKWLAEGVRSGQPMVIRPRTAVVAGAAGAVADERPRLKLTGEGEVRSDPLQQGGNTGTGHTTPHTTIDPRMDPRRHGLGGGGGGGMTGGATGA